MPLERSRGYLVRDFLNGDRAPVVHARELISGGSSYQGFNLLLGAPGSLVYVSNRGAGPAEVSAGSHGLSNHLLDTDWPKVHSGRERLDELLKEEKIDVEALFAVLADRVLTPGEIPENFETRLAPERLMKHYFIVSPEYGTRSSTVVLIGRNGEVEFMERQFDPEGKATDTRSFEW